MSVISLRELRASVIDKTAFTVLDDYRRISEEFLTYLASTPPTNIISPLHPNYRFYQFGQEENHKITRPLNSTLYLTNANKFNAAFKRFIAFLNTLRQHREKIVDNARWQKYIAGNELHEVVYTMQQSIGCIADSFSESNQARKRTGQLFENLIKLIIREIGLVCEPRTIKIPIPDTDGDIMRYELDVVFSRNPAVLAAERSAGTLATSANQTGEAIEPQSPSPAAKIDFISEHEVVGSVKTTSKDRIDKIFLDKFLMTQLLGRDIPVVAVFLHDVQRSATGSGEGKSIFGIASTFKTGHFLGYTAALNKLDGVYYVDPRPEMRTNPRLQAQIRDFQQFLVYDLWTLTK